MKRRWTTWPGRFVRWQFGGPFQSLPSAFGSSVPPELRLFRYRAGRAQRRGFGKVATAVPARHGKTRPARQDPALERQ